MKHYQIRFNYDKKLIGTSEMPYTIEITSKEALDFFDENLNTLDFCNNIDFFHEKIPSHIEGKIQTPKKKLIDYMSTCPFVTNLEAIVSEKVKNIIENLHVRQNEFYMKEIHVRNFNEPYYLLFIPLIKDSDFCFPECRFWNSTTNKRDIVFQDRDSWFKAIGVQFQKVVLKSVYKDFDLIATSGGGTFFSKRIITEFEKQNVLGYEIINKGYFYRELSFCEK